MKIDASIRGSNRGDRVLGVESKPAHRLASGKRKRAKKASNQAASARATR